MAQLVKCQPRKPADLHSDPSTHVKHQTRQHPYICDPRAGGVYSNGSSSFRASYYSQSVRVSEGQWETVWRTPERQMRLGVSPLCVQASFFRHWTSLTDFIYWSGTQKGLCVVRTQEKERKKIESGRDVGTSGESLLGACPERKAWPQLCVRTAS